MNANNFSGFSEPVMLLRRSPGLFLPDEGVFSRLFPELPPHEPESEGALAEIAERLYDKDDEAGPGGQVDKFPANQELPAGYTFFAQFVAHDLSFDASHFGDRSFDGVQHANLRSPRLDLDHVYGGDPDLNEHLYETDSEGNSTYKFRIGKTREADGKFSGGEDLPRWEHGRAVIPDQREDQHVIISQLHLAMMKLHNAMMDRLEPQGLKPRAMFFQARMLTRWYYQYVIVTDLLPRMLGPAGMQTFDAYRERWEGWQREMIEPPVSAGVPVEFSAGVYRIGHFTLRSAYRVNGKVDPLPLFAPGPGANGKPVSLKGFGPRPASLTVSWDYLLEVNGRKDHVQWARMFGPKLSGTLKDIPGADPIPGGKRPRGLAELDLERGLRLGLPSGQAVANRLGLPTNNSHDNDPLWYYAMKEARDNGRAVGPVSAAILSKVFLDLLHLDPGSYRYQQPTWKPGDLRNGLASLLHLANMPFDDGAALP